MAAPNGSQHVSVLTRSKTTVEHLCSYVLVEIFSYLDTESKVNVAQVCKAWRDAVYSRQLWKDLRVHVHLDLDTKTKLARPCCIPWKNLHSCGKSNQRKRRDHRTDRYSTKYYQRPHVLLKILGERGISRLTVCCVVDSQYFEDDTKTLHRFIPDLQELIFGDGVLPCSNIFPLFQSLKFQFLHTLVFEEGNCVSKSCIKTIGMCMPALKCLSLKACDVDNDIWHELALLKTLSRLDISATLCSDHDIGLLCGINNSATDSSCEGNLSSLNSLAMERCPHLTGESLKYLSKRMQVLSSLNIGFNEGFRDQDAIHIAKMKSLRYLHAPCCRFTDNVLRILAENGSQLMDLNLSGNIGIMLNDNGLKNFSLPSLRRLNLSECGITKARFICDRLPQLTHLDISYTLIGDKSLAYINKKLLNLTFLSVYMCPRLTSRGFESLRSTFTVFGNSSDGFPYF